MRKRFLSHAVMAALAVSGSLAVPALAQAQAKGTLVYCSEASPEGFDTAQFTTGTTFDAADQAMFNRLVDFKIGTTEMIPSLAQSWTVSPDGKTVIFRLRPGVKFHTTEYFTPSREFNADDVVFTFERMVNKDHPFNKAYPVQFPYAADTGLDSNIAAVEKVDAMTVAFHLKSADFDFLAKVAMPFASIQSAEYTAKLLQEGKAAQINQLPVGTGPFTFVRYQKDAQIRYKANGSYWEAGLPKVANLVFAITKDASVRFQKLKANECQISVYPAPADVAAMKSNPALKVLEAPGFNIGYVNYNTEKGHTKSADVRRALDMAINRDAIIKAVYQGYAVSATNPMPPSLYGYDKGLKNPAYNPEEAKKLLAKAGLPDGFELNLWAMPVQRPYNPNAKLMAEMIQSDWAKIGVKAKIVSYEWGEYIKRMKNGEHDSGMMGWTGDFASPDNFLSLLICSSVGGNNYARYCSKDFDALVLKARGVRDEAERAKLYTQAIGIFKKDMPWSTIAHSVTNQPARKEVQNFQVIPFGLNQFKYVSLK
ncbi:ABC transporter substrate-binding protein [Hydrogenophaga soli]